MTLKQAFDLFIFDRQTFCGDKTIENYENTIRYFIQWLESERRSTRDQIDLDSITTSDLKQYVVWLRNRSSNEQHPFKDPGGKLSARTVRNYTKDLKTFYNFLAVEGYAEDRAASLKVIKAERKVIIPLSALDVEELDKYFNLKSATGCRNYCIVHLMLDAGLRADEVRILRIQDVNFDNKYIRIRGKGNKERLVPMARNLRKYMYEYVYLHRNLVNTDAFFSGSSGHVLTSNGIKSLFARMRNKTGIDRLHPHLLRHTFATCFILGGGSVEMLRILLGHESINTTQMYMHIASVYEFNEYPYELDPVFFNTYQRRSPRKRR